MKKTLFALALGVAALCGAAIAQVNIPPLRGPLAQNDLVLVVPNGFGSAQSVYSYAGAIAGIEQYSYQVPVTAFSITPANGTSLLYLNPAGTLATGTLTMQAQPSDGQRFTIETTQTQTAITIQANTGQTLASGTFGLTTPTALVANTRYTWMYIASLATWTRLA
jgi:hypothetical protein